MEKPKSYLEQFSECKTNDLVGQGDFQSFEEHPEMLPLFPKLETWEAISKGEFKGFSRNTCLKFGGFCSSGNEGCRKLRGVESELPEQIFTLSR